MSSTSNSAISDPAASAPLRFGSLREWLSWQERLHFTAIELGLDRCRTVAERMGLLEHDFRVISIAGTNGKGSCAMMLDLIYRNAGYSVGKYTSPHLLRYNERILVNGREIDDQSLCHSFNRIDRARGDISLTYFEFGTLAALDLFRRAGVDITVLEVGLGGRLDAVNILDPDVALISTIDLDHERWLGFDRESIGREKAGIYRADRPAVCGDPDPPASVLQKGAASAGRFYRLGRDFDYAMEDDAWSWRAAGSEVSGLPRPSLNQDCQVQNAAGALMCVAAMTDSFPVTPEVIRASLGEFRLPGRFQMIPGRTPFILDVAHNRQAAEVLAGNLTRLPCAGETHLVVGMLRDKIHEAVLSMLAETADTWWLVTLEDERGAQAEQLHAALDGIPHRGGVRLFGCVPDALRAVMEQAGAGDRIVVTGSFVTVGAAMRWLGLGG